MIDSILVPVDDTPDSERMIPVAVAVASAMNASIEFLTIDSPNSDRGPTSSYHRGLIDALPAGIAGTGTIELGSAPVAEQLLDAYRSRPRSLLALATRAPGSLWQWLAGGSVGDDVIEETVRPVLLAGPRCEVAPGSVDQTMHTTASLDGTGLDEQVVETAIDWSRAVGSPLTFVRIVTAPSEPTAHGDACADLELRAARARNVGVDARVKVVDAGEAGRAVLHHLSAAGGILVVGSHRRGTFSRAIHGSNSLWLTHRSPLPVLVAGFTSIAVPTDPRHEIVDISESQVRSGRSRTTSELVGWSSMRSMAV